LKNLLNNAENGRFMHFISTKLVQIDIKI